MSTATSPREILIETALALFARHGFQAVGIDRLLSEAGVAKMTLYKHFRSKDELILEVLRRRDQRWREWLHASIRASAPDPRGQLLAVFDALGEWFGDADFNGCLFINATAEFGGGQEAVRLLAAAHKQQLKDDLADLAEAAGADDPEALARALVLLVEGAIVVAHVEGRYETAGDAKRAAEVLLLAAIPGRAERPRGGAFGISPGS
jgi:AcrR family transcriptional regulator